MPMHRLAIDALSIAADWAGCIGGRRSAKPEKCLTVGTRSSQFQNRVTAKGKTQGADALCVHMTCGDPIGAGSAIPERSVGYYTTVFKPYLAAPRQCRSAPGCTMRSAWPTLNCASSAYAKPDASSNAIISWRRFMRPPPVRE
jgi:hypothetical protein